MSSYTVLYRKYRPSDFSEVKGQDAIVRTLKNQIKADRVGHAYLLCGTRGTGKTSIAKIFAKAVNCEHPVDGNPCGVCKSCQDIARGTSMNVIEIDAASNNGVDNIRQIREEVQYAPTDGRYRVYIIDEVHMLSAGAFNALLKTLEEPPSYVIFILATTEAHKIPITILSRCQRYDLKRIPGDVLTQRLMELMQEEGIKAEEKAIRYVAKMADGSFRDALSLLEQCISFYLGEELTYDRVLEVLGAVDTKVYSDLLRGILKSDTEGCLTLIEQLVMSGRELTQFVTDFTWYLRNLLLLKTAGEPEDLVDVSEDRLTSLLEEAEMTKKEELIRFIRIFSELANQMKYSASKRVILEIAVIRLMQPEMEPGMDSIPTEAWEGILGRVAKLERELEQGNTRWSAGKGTASLAAATENPQAGDSRSPEEIQEQAYNKANPEDVKKLMDAWQKIIRETDGMMKIYLKNCRLTTSGDNRLILNFSTELAYRHMNSEKNRRRLEEIILNTTGKVIEVQCTLIRAGTEEEDRFIRDCENINMMIFEEEE